jgi:hypothetical protein
MDAVPERDTPDSKILASDDWLYLNVGDAVVVQRAGELSHTGHVDDIAEDARLFWVQLDGGRGRILLYEGDGSVVMRSELVSEAAQSGRS